MWWSDSHGTIEVNITKAQAHKGYHMGACDSDISELRGVPAIRRQLEKINPAILSKSLKEIGAWDEVELSNHNENLSRLLWIACGDIVDNTK